MHQEEEVIEWLRKAYPEYGLKIREIYIPSVKAPERSSKRKFELFQQAFYGRDSRQHGWLKWFAINHLLLMAAFEVDIFIPPILGKYGNGAGKVLPRGHSYRAIPGCRFQRADVYSFDTLVEVGVTSPQSLVEPLWCYAVKEVIWLPFQTENIQSEWEEFNIKNRALLFMRGKP